MSGKNKFDTALQQAYRTMKTGEPCKWREGYRSDGVDRARM